MNLQHVTTVPNICELSDPALVLRLAIANAREQLEQRTPLPVVVRVKADPMTGEIIVRADTRTDDDLYSLESLAIDRVLDFVGATP